MVLTPNLASLAANWFQPPVAEDEEEEEAPRAPPFEAAPAASSEPMSATSSSGTHFSSWRPERLKGLLFFVDVHSVCLERRGREGGGGGERVSAR